MKMAGSSDTSRLDAINYRAGDRAVRLWVHPQLFTVRLHEARDEPVDARRAELLKGSEPVAYLPREGLMLYRSEHPRDVISQLQAAGVQQTFPVYRHGPEAADAVIPSGRLLVQFKPQVSP